LTGICDSQSKGGIALELIFDYLARHSKGTNEEVDLALGEKKKKEREKGKRKKGNVVTGPRPHLTGAKKRKKKGRKVWARTYGKRKVRE